MDVKLLDWLACPECGEGLTLTAPLPAGAGEVDEGRLACGGCPAEYPIRAGIPRFAGDQERDFENFAYQWRRWGQVQIDRLAGHRLSEGRLFAETGWAREWFAGKLVMDVGCGAGRFADVAVGLGAEVIALDISGAVDACRVNLAPWGNKVHCIQASLFALPLKKDIADGAFSLGVIQHTPVPERAVASIIAHLKPGGRLAVNFYERNWWPLLQPIKYALRLFTPRLKPARLLALCRALVAALFPISRALGGIRKVRLLNVMLPICAVHDPALTRDQQYAWTLLDTFDWYGPKYELRQSHRRLGTLLRELAMSDVRTRPGVIQATKPSAR